MSIRGFLQRVRVIPVLAVENVRDAAPLAQALYAGGLSVLEVTLRTAAALPALESMRRALPDAVIGAGTLTRPEDFTSARAAGAQFAVSPGFTLALAQAASAAGLPLLPGVMTPSEILAAMSAGYDTLKFFPAEPAGGTASLSAFASVFPGIKFCPTGGITAERAASYLALPNVLCVGGSWVAPPALIARGDWSAIEKLARSAAAYQR